jgi:Ca-activated chloride channel family protein
MRFRVPAAAVLAALPLPALTQTQTQADTPSTIIVLDGSGSMWGQIDGRP